MKQDTLIRDYYYLLKVARHWQSSDDYRFIIGQFIRSNAVKPYNLKFKVVARSGGSVTDYVFELCSAYEGYANSSEVIKCLGAEPLDYINYLRCRG